MPQLQEQAFLEIPCGDAYWVKALNQPQRLLYLFDRPRPH
jgi:hypothetical protein